LPRRTDMSQTEAKDWIAGRDLYALDLPRASQEEIRRMVLAADNR